MLLRNSLTRTLAVFVLGPALAMAQTTDAPNTAGQVGQPGQAERQNQADRPGQTTQNPTDRPAQANPTRQADRPGQANPDQADRPGQAVRELREQPGQARAGGERGGQADRQLVNILAGKMMLANHAEIELGKVAAERAKDEKVKQFAQKMIQDHQQMNEELRRIAPDAAQRTPQSVAGSRPGQSAQGQSQLGQTQPGQSQPGQTQPGQGQLGQTQPGQTQPGQSQPGQTQPGQSQPGQSQLGQTQPGQTQPGLGNDEQRTERAYRSELDSDLTGQSSQAGQGGRVLQQLSQVSQRMADKCLESSKELLEQYQGDDFDMGYLGHQIIMHTSALASLEAIHESNVGTQEFRQVVQTAQHHVQEHLNEAKELARHVADRDSGQERPETRTDAQPRSSIQPGSDAQPGAQPGANNRSGSATQPGSEARPGSLPERD